MFSPLFCFEQVKTLKNFSRKLFTSKIKKKVEEETKSSVWDFKTPKLAQIHQHSSGRYGRYVYNQSTLPDWGSALWTWRNFGRDLEKIRKVSLLEQITQLSHAPSLRTERNIQKPGNPCLLPSCPEQNCLVTYHTLYRACTSCLAC